MNYPCLLDSEETIQTVLNEAGTLATGEALKQFDTDGGAIQVGASEMDEQRETKQDLSNAL
jgi:hypothetical protein